jgi:hypothetical protein
MGVFSRPSPSWSPLPSPPANPGWALPVGQQPFAWVPPAPGFSSPLGTMVGAWRGTVSEARRAELEKWKELTLGTAYRQ